MDNKDFINEIADMLERHTTRVELKIENEVTKRLEALFDGYKLADEKRWQLEKKIEGLEQRVENLEVRAM